MPKYHGPTGHPVARRTSAGRRGHQFPIMILHQVHQLISVKWPVSHMIQAVHSAAIGRHVQ